jgi:signal transduction histidine kinase
LAVGKEKPGQCGHLLEISDSVPAGIITVNSELKVDWFNRRWAEELGRYSSCKVAIGIVFSSLIPDGRLEKMLIEALSGKSGKMYCHNFSAIEHGVNDKFYDITASPIKSEKGAIVGAMLMAMDVTETQKNMRGVVAAKNEAEFYVDLMSHDIRNFNQVTMGYIELLQLGDNLGETERAYLEKAQKGVTGSNKLIDNIKQVRLIRQYAGKNLSRMDLSEVLKTDASDVKKAFSSAKIVLGSGKNQQPIVIADDYIHDIFRHILENAVKYDPHEEKIVEVSLNSLKRDGRDYWVVKVADHGKGIADDKKASVFSRMSTTTKGAGVGLSIVSVLVGKYGGCIYVEDRKKGDPSQGSIFTVELPKA